MANLEGWEPARPNVHVRRARKAYGCNNCSRVIERGELYIECKNLDGLRQRYHVEHGQERGLIRPVAR